jgi:tetratricopeptide (TPR) repeat protein
VIAVPDISAVEIPRHLNWQDFQRSSVILFRCILRDELLQEFGRDGQKQHGIDLLGCRDSDTSRPVGIQCRRKKTLTPKEMREDAEEARAIKPALAELIFATTAERDKAVQLDAAALTQELIASGWNCRVTVMAWQDLQQEIALHPRALRAFWPSGPTMQQPVIDAVKEGNEPVLALLREMKEGLGQSRQIISEEYDSDLAPEAKREPVGLHTRISTLRELIGKGRTRTALEGFEKLLAQEPPLPPYARYRVIANIGAVHFNAGRIDLALKYSGEALALRPDDHKTQTNLGYAEVVSGDVEGGRKRVRAVLEKHPDHAPAASLIIQSYAQDPSITDPLTLVPEASHNAVEVKVARIMFLRAHDDKQWEGLAQSGAAEHPDNRHLERLAAEAVLEPALADTDIVLGKPAPKGFYDAVRKSAETLERLWKQEMDAEDPHPQEAYPLAHNAAAALRFVGDVKRAACILDDTIQKIGRDPDLVRCRALLHLAADEDKSAASLLETIDDPEGLLFAAQLAVAKDPEGARSRLDKLDVSRLPERMRSIVPEIRGEIALVLKDQPEFEAALKALEEQGAPFAPIAVLRARAQEKGLIKVEAEAAGEEEDVEADPAIKAIIRDLPAHEATMSYADRVQLGQFLERHNADETASNLLDGRVSTDRDSVALRTYLSASICAHLFARAKKVFEALPPDLIKHPAYQRMAATYHWNTGDAKAAEPFIRQLREASPERLDLLLWQIDALVRLNAEDKVRQILTAEVETKADGPLSAKRRLVVALMVYGQRDRARAFGYKLLALNRDDPAAWMAFMSTMFSGEHAGRDLILSTTITPEHTVELRLPSNEVRRYVIESDPEVRRVSQEAITADHEIARLVRNLKPGDQFEWPGNGGKATVVSAKHKYLDAFHTALGRFNERFPAAKGFQQVNIGTPEKFDLSAIEEMLKARSDHIATQSALYAEGRISLSMLAFLTGVDPIDCMLGLAELGKVYRVSIGSREERRLASASITVNQTNGCIIDAATYHCIRRLSLEGVVRAVCGPIGISQATADIYHARVAALDAFGGEKGGTMTMRNGRVAIVEDTTEHQAATRALVKSDRNWLTENAETFPAAPMADPPPIIRRLSSVAGASFFDDAYAADGSGRLLLSDDLFTRQIAAQLGARAVSLQPVLMRARERGLMSQTDYAKAITDLIEFGQQFIAIDAATLLAARMLDTENNEARAGKRFRMAARALGGAQCDPKSHCSVAAEFVQRVWNTNSFDLQDYPVISHVLLAVLRERTNDYPQMLDRIDALLRGNPDARQYLRRWARGHFLKWPSR